MLIGAHMIVHSTDPEADRKFLRDALKFPSVDAGGGYVIFGLPASEMAVHESEKNDVHELYLMCDKVDTLIGDLKRRGIACSPAQDTGWGLLTQVTLPGGGKLGVYEPRHARPAATGGRAPAKAAKRPAKAPARKSRKTVKKAARRR
jgi:hypothetical protein